jgi:hypothetical protein
VEPNQPDRLRGERLKLWGVLLIALLIIAFVVARYLLEKR